MTEEAKKRAANAKATRKWRENNKEHFAYLSARTKARSFVRHHATDEDMKELNRIYEMENKKNKKK